MKLGKVFIIGICLAWLAMWLRPPGSLYSTIRDDLDVIALVTHGRNQMRHSGDILGVVSLTIVWLAWRRKSQRKPRVVSIEAGERRVLDEGSF